MVKFLKLPKFFAVIVYVLLAVALVVIEEFIMALETYVGVCKIDKITRKNTIGDALKPFEDLPKDEQAEYDHYYESISKVNKWRLEVMAREASIQLTYQNALIIYEFLYPTVLELNYTSWKYPSARWMTFLGLQIISILLSGYSTFIPVIKDIEFRSKVEQQPLGFWNYLTKILQMLIHILISSGVVFLLIGHIFINHHMN